MKVISLLLSAFLLLSSFTLNARETNFSPSELSLSRYRSDVKTLASDEFEGRAPLSKGEEKTVQFLVNSFKEMGLSPAFGDSYTQPVPLAKITADQSMTLNLAGLTFNNGTEFTARTQQIRQQVSLDNNDIVFVGYGINAPEYNWNDYANIDVKGKTLIMLVNDPGFSSQNKALFNGNAMTYYGRWTYKYEEAARQGAKAVFIIHESMPAGYGWGVVQNSNSNTKFTLVDDNKNLSQVGVMGWLHLNTARALFSHLGLDYRALKKAAGKRGFKPLPLNATANLTINNQIALAESKNVAAILPGKEAKEEWVALHAHWDHLGKTTENGKEVIYNGGVDNASGVAGVLNLARAFVNRSKKQPLKRTLMFGSFTAEETGLIGAQHFAQNTPISKSNMVAFLNIDGMNVNKAVDYILQYGNKVSSLEAYLADAAKKQKRVAKLDPRPQNGLFFRSDHFALAREGVPSLLFMSLGDTDPSFISQKYHKAADDYYPSWELEGVNQDLTLIGDIMLKLANNNDWPFWIEESDFKAKRALQRPN